MGVDFWLTTDLTLPVYVVFEWLLRIPIKWRIIKRKNRYTVTKPIFKIEPQNISSIFNSEMNWLKNQWNAVIEWRNVTVSVA